MAEITKGYRQEVGPMRFIGKQYGDDDRVNGMFDVRWAEFMDKGWEAALESLAEDPR